MSETLELTIKDRLDRQREALADLCCDREFTRNEWEYEEDRVEVDRLWAEIVRLDDEIYRGEQRLWQSLVDRMEEIGGPLTPEEVRAQKEYRDDLYYVDEPEPRNERERLDQEITETVSSIRGHERRQGLPRFDLPQPQFVTKEAAVAADLTPSAAAVVVEKIFDEPSGPGF
jgi:hypothetical protein